MQNAGTLDKLSSLEVVDLYKKEGTMNRKLRLSLAVAFGLAFTILLVHLSPGSRTASQETKKPELKCCYTNPQYSGVCEVTPAEGETCSTILAYLNNPNSQGKNYCGGTSIRGGWKQVPCDEKQATGSVEKR